LIVGGVVIGANFATVPEWQESEMTTSFTLLCLAL
jgi:hypothetical protein